MFTPRPLSQKRVLLEVIFVLTEDLEFGTNNYIDEQRRKIRNVIITPLRDPSLKEAMKNKILAEI